MASTADLGKLKVDDFKPHLKTSFEMQGPKGEVVTLELTQAVSNGTELPKVLKTRDKQEIKSRDGGGFTLQFVSSGGPWLPQATYPVKHPSLGTLEMFLVPIGPLTGGHGYQAVFG